MTRTMLGVSIPRRMSRGRGLDPLSELLLGRALRTLPGFRAGCIGSRSRPSVGVGLWVPDSCMVIVSARGGLGGKLGEGAVRAVGIGDPAAGPDLTRG
jgi:hypothetical protein